MLCEYHSCCWWSSACRGPSFPEMTGGPRALLLVWIGIWGAASLQAQPWPALSQQREACSEPPYHLIVGQCHLPGKFRCSLFLLNQMQMPWQEQSVRSHFNAFVCMTKRRTCFFGSKRDTHSHGLFFFFLREGLSSEIYVLCFILSEVGDVFQGGVCGFRLQGWQGLFLSILPSTPDALRSCVLLQEVCLQGGGRVQPPTPTDRDSQVLLCAPFFQI